MEADRALHLGQRLHPVDHLGREPGELRWCRARAPPGGCRRTRRSAPWPTRRAPPPSPPARGRSPARWRSPRCGAGCASRSRGRSRPGRLRRRAPGRRTSAPAGARTPRAAPRCRRRAGARPARPTAARPARPRPAAHGRCPTSSTGMPTAEQQEPDDGAPAERLDPGFGEIADRGHRRDARRPDRGPERGADRDHQPHRHREHRRCAGRPPTSPLGMLNPRESTSDMSSCATTTPSSTPAADASAPTTPASTTTDVMTCRRDAPMARSNPSSWVRWVTRIVKVLKMMNAPTTTPSAAKPSSRPVRRSTNSPTSWLSLCTIWSGSITSYAGPSAGAQRAPELRDGHAGVAAHVHRVESAGRGGDVLGRGQVEGEERERPGVGVAEPEQAHQVERPARAGRQHVDGVADADTGLPRGVDVDHQLVGAPRRAAAGAAVVDEQHRTAFAPADERHAGRGHALVDRFAVAADELRVALHEAARAMPRRRSRAPGRRRTGACGRGRRRRATGAPRTTTSTSDSDCSNTRLNDSSSVSVNT